MLTMRVGIQRTMACNRARLMSVTRAHTSLSEQAAKAEQDIKTFKPVAAISDHMEAIHQASLKNDDSLARILFHQESEDAINRQINVEYTNCYLYHSMSAYFARDTVGLHGFAAYFRDQSDDERHHAQLFMDFLSKRGGRTQLGALSAPPNNFADEKRGDALNAMELALALEKLNFEKITDLSKVAEKHEDPQFADFIDEMLQEQAVEVKECADMVSQLRRIGKGYPVFQYDQYLQGKMKGESGVPPAGEE